MFNKACEKWSVATNAEREIRKGTMTTEQVLAELKILYPNKEKRIEIIRAINVLLTQKNTV